MKLGRIGLSISRPQRSPNFDITITSDGLSRRFLAYVPPGLPANAGLVIAYHGGGGAPDAFKAGIGMDAMASTYGFAVAYPEAYGGNWTDGRASTAGGANDVLFTQDLISYMGTRWGISSSKVFVTGMSNGGLFCHWLRYQSPSTIAGMATCSANIPDSYVASITAAGPVLMFQGLNDLFMLAGGGVNAALGPESMASTLTCLSRYATANGASTTATVTAMPDIDTGDGCTINKRDYTGGSKPVTGYVATGGGHQWFGGNGSGIGNTPRDISATQTMVSFFQPHGLY